MDSRVFRTFLASIIVPSLLFAQSGVNDNASKTTAVSLSKAVDMGTSEYRLFEDEGRKIKFRLVTSWIPGEKHQGMFRYKLDAWIDIPKTDTGAAAYQADQAVEKLLNRVSRCTITLDLYDKGEFVLRRHRVPFIKGVDAEHARLTSLYANDAFQMDAQEYREFIGSGSWTILWDCGLTP